MPVDALRLQFVLDHDVRVVQSRDGFRACRFLTSPRKLQWLGPFAASARGAIDVAIASRVDYLPGLRPKHTRQELLEAPIVQLRRERFERGLVLYRKSPGEPFQGDPLVEFIEEGLDQLNYGEELLNHETDPLRLGSVLEALDSSDYALVCVREAYR